MGAPKVTAARIMYIAAVQIVLTTVGFILYTRPYLWAWTALEYYKEVYCGEHLNTINSKYHSYDTEHRASVIDKVTKYRRQCDETYIESFKDQFYENCLNNCRPAFVHIPLVSCFLILGIVAALHWAPFHSKTLKKPGFIFAFFFSLILVSINIGQIVSIIVPIINPNASPNRISLEDNRSKCGYATEIVALSLIIGSSVLSALIASFVIRLYVIRVRYQDDHVDDLNMGNEGGEREHWKEKELLHAAKSKTKTQKIKSEKERQSSADSGKIKSNQTLKSGMTTSGMRRTTKALNRDGDDDTDIFLRLFQ